MTVLVHFSGPSFSKTVTLAPGGTALEAGRDPQAPVHLPDEERLLSRRHVSIEWADTGARLTVLSKVNAVFTSRGDVAVGQSVVLGNGDKAQLGRYALTVEVAAAAAASMAPLQPAPAPQQAEDPLGLFSTSPPALHASVFDNPFFQPAPSAAPAHTPATVLDQLSGSPPVGAPRGLSGPGSTLDKDVLGVFDTGSQPAKSSASIDDFLGKSPTPRGPLGAAQMLKPQAMQAERRLATDHVHDFNLPLTPAIAKAPPPAPLPFANDPLAALDQFMAGLPVTPAPQVQPLAPAPMLPPAMVQPVPMVPPAPLVQPIAQASPVVPMAPVAQPAPVLPPANPQVDLDFSLDSFIDEGTKPFLKSRKSGAAPEVPLAAAVPPAVVMPQAPVGKPSPGVPPMARAQPMPAPVEPVAAAVSAAPARAPESRPSVVPDSDALQALCRGLGIAPPPGIKPEDFEAMGQSVRQLVECIAELLSVRAELKRELKSPDRTLLVARENNPLKSGLTIDELLNYLLFLPRGAAGYMPAQRALHEATSDLKAHEFASLVALRSTVEGTIRDFDPNAMAKALKGNKKSILPKGLWDLYTQEYQRRSEHMADWLEEVFNKHYLPAYTREAERARRRS